MHGVIGEFLASDPVRGVMAIVAFFVMIAILRGLSSLDLFSREK